MVDGTSARDDLDARAEPFDRDRDHDADRPESHATSLRRIPEPVEAPRAKRQEPEPAGSEKPPAGPAKAASAPTRRKRGLLRPVLFALLPVALVVGGYDYVTGGQVMSTDNAYVQARSLGVSTDVSGTVAAIEVHDNQHVEKGQVLFRLKSDSFRIAIEGAEASSAPCATRC